MSEPTGKTYRIRIHLEDLFEIPEDRLSVMLDELKSVIPDAKRQYDATLATLPENSVVNGSGVLDWADDGRDDVRISVEAHDIDSYLREVSGEDLED